MSSPFIGLQVKLTLHTQPNPIRAKILSIDTAANTLAIQKEDGSRSVLNRTDIASLAAYTPPTHSSPKSKSAHLVPGQVAQTPNSAQTPAEPTDSASPKLKSRVPSASKSTHVDPAILSFTRSNDINTPVPSSSPAPIPYQYNQPPEQAFRSAHKASRSSTPSESPRPKAAAVATKAAKKRANPISRGSSPAAGLGREPSAATNEDFDFGAGLAAFDKKRIWDEIRSADNTDPASLLVSHNRIANESVPLVRGPNGVGPAKAAPALQDPRGRATQRDGQQKLRPDEMVCSPSPERQQEESALSAKQQKMSVISSPTTPAPGHSVKPSYEELENKIRQLQAELVLARRRNVLLEELAGLGRGSSSREEDVQDIAESPTPASPSSTRQAPFSPIQTAAVDPALLSTTNGVGSLSLQPASLKPKAPTPDGLATTSRPVPNPQDLKGNENSVSSLPLASAAAAQSTSKESFFGHIVDTPVLTLLFPTAAIQHASLARMEAFYESDSSSKRYLNLAEARDERICRNYQGFNFPIEQGVKQWLTAMWDATASSSRDATPMRWWEAQCSDEENNLLDLFVQVGAISEQEAYKGLRSTDEGNSSISYVISSIASQANSTLPHELLHALYFLSASYRSFVAAQWSSLSPPIKKVIENDLSLRKYAPSVYEDEFQAYLAEGPSTEKEFGNKPAPECKLIGQQLREQVQHEWTQLGYSPQGKENLWEDAKWDTLDRYAAHQKALKKTSKLAGAASAKKARK